LPPGDRVLGCVNGHFSTNFCRTATAHGIEVDRLEVPYGAGVPAERVAERLRADQTHELRAVLMVHNETSTGVTSSVARVRQALDEARHPALLPSGLDSDAYIAHANRTLDLSLGVGLGDVKGRVFRIGHLGSLNELELLGGLAGVEMTLRSFGLPVPLGAGLAAAEAHLLE